MFKKIITLITLAFLASCGGNNTTTTTQVSKVDSFIGLLKEQMYVKNVKLVKNSDETKSNKFTIIEVFYSDDTGFGEYDIENFVYDLSLYEVGDSYADYVTKYKEKYISDDDAYFNLPTADTISESTLEYFETNNITPIGGTPKLGDLFTNIKHNTNAYFLLEETVPSTKDLEKIGALQEEIIRTKISESLTIEFGLSEERSEQISRLVQNWSKISNKRKMTSVDANLFVGEIIGTDIENAENVYKKHIEGDSSAYEDMIKNAAQANSISPEHMSDLVNELLIK